MPRRHIALLAVLALVMTGAGMWLAVSRGGDTREAPPGADGRTPTLDECAGVERPADQNACYVLAALDGLEREGITYVEALDERANRDRVLGARCHVLMHDVADLYARNHKITPDNLGEYLPETGNVNCAAGLTHGMTTAALENTTELSPLGGVVAACRSEGTRIKQINCIHGLGHAFMRNTGADMERSLAQCARLGHAVAPDCAPGVFHDYFFGQEGTAGATRPEQTERDPRALCAGLADAFVRPCWVRAVQFSVPPDAPPLTDVGPAVASECTGLAPVQRDGCIAGQAFRSQGAGLDSCFELASMPDVTSCLYGMNADPTGSDVLERCADRPARVQGLCHRWFGRMHATFADPPSDRSFCTALDPGQPRTQCLAGAAQAADPLGTA